MKAFIEQKAPWLWPYILLTRLDKPVGIYLLLWPTLWALWLGAEGMPSIANLFIFVLGVILMRSAGCVINDFADRKVDGHVERTKERPLITGDVTSKQALILFFSLLVVSFLLVLMTNTLTIQLSFAGAALAAIYPFMKRYTHLPQVFLGAAFSWSIPMAFAAEANALSSHIWLIYIANLCWTVAYDTMYAMVDREDDLKIGVKSTAILFGEADKVIISILQIIAVACLLLLANQLNFGVGFYLFLLPAIAVLAYTTWSIRNRDRASCFKAFKQNHWFGLFVFLAFVVNFF